MDESQMLRHAVLMLRLGCTSSCIRLPQYCTRRLGRKYGVFSPLHRLGQGVLSDLIVQTLRSVGKRHEQYILFPRVEHEWTSLDSRLRYATTYIAGHSPPSLHNAGNGEKWEAFNARKFVEQKLGVANYQRASSLVINHSHTH